MPQKKKHNIGGKKEKRFVDVVEIGDELFIVSGRSGHQQYITPVSPQVVMMVDKLSEFIKLFEYVGNGAVVPSFMFRINWESSTQYTTVLHFEEGNTREFLSTTTFSDVDEESAVFAKLSQVLNSWQFFDWKGLKKPLVDAVNCFMGQYALPESFPSVRCMLYQSAIVLPEYGIPRFKVKFQCFPMEVYISFISMFCCVYFRFGFTQASIIEVYFDSVNKQFNLESLKLHLDQLFGSQSLAASSA